MRMQAGIVDIVIRGIIGRGVVVVGPGRFFWPRSRAPARAGITASSATP